MRYRYLILTLAAAFSVLNADVKTRSNGTVEMDYPYFQHLEDETLANRVFSTLLTDPPEGRIVIKYPNADSTIFENVNADPQRRKRRPSVIFIQAPAEQGKTLIGSMFEIYDVKWSTKVLEETPNEAIVTFKTRNFNIHYQVFARGYMADDKMILILYINNKMATPQEQREIIAKLKQI